MSRYPAERHNDEFAKLFASFRAKPENAELTQQDAMVAVSELLGITPWAVKSWLRPEGGKSAYACPKHRVDAFKAALGLKMADLNESQRKARHGNVERARGAALIVSFGTRSNRPS